VAQSRRQSSEKAQRVREGYRNWRSDRSDDSRWRERGDARTDRRGGIAWRDRDGRRTGDARWRGGDDVRWRDRDGRWRDRGDSRWRDGDRRVRRYAGYSYARHAPRHYYTRSFYRPRFAYHSGFSLGITIGAFPSYGFRYRDPYCGVWYSDLGPYYDHCHHHDHPTVILVLDSHSGHPVAACEYADGDWVVDDCY
jgi:hypothetical protein